MASNSGRELKSERVKFRLRVVYEPTARVAESDARLGGCPCCSVGVGTCFGSACEGLGRFDDRSGIASSHVAYFKARGALLIYELMLVVGTSVATDDQDRVMGVFAATTWAGSALSLMLFFSAVPALYSAYVQMNVVDPGLDGSRRG